MKRTQVFGIMALALSLFALHSCSSNEIADSKDVAQNKIYQQYNVNYTEGEKSFKVRGQFRFGGHNGTTLVLNKPATLSFDNALIKVDSGKYAGAYYESIMDAGQLFSSHSFVYKDITGKALENNFLFNQFKLANFPASASKKTDLAVGYSFAPAYQLQNDDYIELRAVKTDSSFTVTHSSSDKGNIIIPAKQLKRQKTAVLTLEATLYRRNKLKEVTEEGGDMEIRYALKPITIKLVD